MHTINIEREIRLSNYTPILCCQNASRNSPKFWQYQRCLSVCQWWRRSRTDGNSTRSVRIQAFPSPMPSKFMRSCSKCSTAGMHTQSRNIWRCTGKSPELLVVVDAEQFNGWRQLHDSYLNGYPDRNAMGFIQPKR